MSMLRESKHITVTIASGAALSDAIKCDRFSGGFIFVPVTWTAADIGFHTNYVRGGTFVEASSTTGSLLDITGVVSGKAFFIPPELFGATYIKLWSQSAGVGVNQSAERTIHVVLKS